MFRTWVIVGCGYTGKRLAWLLAGKGEEVTVTRRDPQTVESLARELGVRGARVDLGKPETLVGLVPLHAIVVCFAPPGSDPDGEIRALLAASTKAARMIYVSSTGVYGPGQGAWVDESFPLAPTTPSGKRRVVAERALARSTIPWVALRVAGIHGPGRGLADRIRAGTYRIVGDGTAHVSRIHVDDLVEVVVRAGASTATGPINVADDDPAPIGEVADAIAAQLGVPPPRRERIEDVPVEVAGMLAANRRIANAKMKELGVVLRYPSWRDAL